MKLEESPFDLVCVTWDDAEVDSGWDKVAEPKEALVLTVGFMMKKTKKHIVIAASITAGEYNTNQRIQIPMGMVKKIDVLKEKAP